MVKILIVTPESPAIGGAGGIATYVEYAAKAHLQAGHEVHILSWQIGDGVVSTPAAVWKRLLPLTTHHFTCLRFRAEELTSSKISGWEMSIAVLVSQHAERLIDDWLPDVVEGTDYLFPLLPLLQRHRAGLLKYSPKFVTFHHGLQEDVWNAAANLSGTFPQKIFAGEMNALRLADLIVAPSEFSRKNLIRKGLHSDRIVVLREPFSPQPNVQQSAHRRDHAFVYFGRVNFAKGVDRAVRYFNFLYAQDNEVTLDLIGPHSPFPFRKSRPIDVLSVAARANKRLTTHDRRFEQGELDHILSSFGTFLNFSRTETFSYTTVEALSRGLRVIVDRDSAAAELFPPRLRDLLPRKWETDPSEARRANLELPVDETWSFARNLLAPTSFAEKYHQHLNEVQTPSSSATSLGQTTLSSTGSVLNRSSRIAARPADVSILISSFNDGPLLLDAIQSIVTQTTPVGEIIVYNDGSSDPESLDVYTKLDSLPEVRVFSGECNLGLIGGRNFLLSKATKDFCVFLDADDQLESKCIESMVHAYNSSETPVEAVIPWTRNTGARSDIVCDFLLNLKYHLVANDFRMTSLLNTSVAKRLGFRHDLCHGEADDWDFWLRFSAAGFSALCMPEALFVYNVHPNSMSNSWSEGQAALTAEMLGRTFANFVKCELFTDDWADYLQRMTYRYRHFAGQ